MPWTYANVWNIGKRSVLGRLCTYCRLADIIMIHRNIVLSIIRDMVLNMPGHFAGTSTMGAVQL